MMNDDKEKILIEEEQDIDLAKIPKTEFYTKNDGHKSRILQVLAIGLVLLGAIGFVLTGCLVGWKIVDPVVVHIDTINPESRRTSDDESSRSIKNYSEFCNEQPETGTCRGSFEKWYFDTKSGLCKTFVYGGCDGNQNNFETQDQCEKSCSKFEKVQTKTVSTTTELEDEDEDVGICELEFDIGPCRASMPRYFFNSKSLKCELFIYGGCSGNRNNFENAEDCEKACFLSSL